MELNENPKPGENHQMTLHIVTGLFSGPYLSFGLLAFLALVVLTDYAYVLMREPLVYWFDYSREAIRDVGGFNVGPLAALGIHLIYIAVVWVILRILNRKISMILWSGLLFLHLSTFIVWPPTCSYQTLRIFPAWLCFINRDVITLIIGLLVGFVLSRSIIPSEQNNQESGTAGWIKSRLGLSKLAATFSLLWLIILGTGIGIASHIPTTTWRPIITEHSPSPRYEMMVAYNTKLNQAILFGGSVEASSNNWTKVNETWKWDGQDWKQLNPKQSPPARARGGMAYDPNRNVIVLFGGWNDLGKSLNDTWEWDGNTWNEVGNCDTCLPPPSRGCHNLFYDTAREEVVLYGGCNENQYFFNDAWSWDGTRWSWIDIQDSPVASGAPIIYDSNNKWAVGFLAWQPSGTWLWDKNGWSKQAPATEPPLRGNAMMANDPATGNSIMFGGAETKNNATTFFLDTWMLNGRKWRKIEDVSNPPGRWGHIMFFDTKLNKFILFGGFDGTTALNDLWEINAEPESEK